MIIDPSTLAVYDGFANVSNIVKAEKSEQAYELDYSNLKSKSLDYDKYAEFFFGQQLYHNQC